MMADLSDDDIAMRGQWRPITTAPRDPPDRILIYCPEASRKVREAWWAIPYEGAPTDRGWWQTMDGVVLSADVHRTLQGAWLGATHWMPLPDPPSTTTGSPRRG